MEKIQTGIFDDHPIITAGLEQLLPKENSHINIILSVNNAAQLHKEVLKKMPDVLILDVVAPEVNGLDLFKAVIDAFPSVKVIAYTTLKSPILVENLLDMGVKGFVNKSENLKELSEAILNVHNGNLHVPEKYKFLTSRFRLTGANSLTQRELEILQLIAKEETNQQIAIQLSISVKTVENHRLSLFKKLGVKNSAGLVLAATRLGYIS